MALQVKLTPPQTQALGMVQAGHHVYIGGQAGCGKSMLVAEVSRWAETGGKSAALTCTTGVACSNYSTVLKPMTIHKWSGVGDGRLSGKKIRELMSSGDDRLQAAKARIMSTEILVIDEISMLSRKMFDMVESVLRIKDISHSFGNIHIVVVGDFLQLPPVRNLRYDVLGEFSITSDFWPRHSMFLESVFRQKDKPLIDLIRQLSFGQLTDDGEQIIASLARPLPDGDGEEVKLYATNLLVDMYNRSSIMNLADQMYSFAATDHGDQRALDSLVVPPTLWLKVIYT